MRLWHSLLRHSQSTCGAPVTPVTPVCVVAPPRRPCRVRSTAGTALLCVTAVEPVAVTAPRIQSTIIDCWAPTDLRSDCIVPTTWLLLGYYLATTFCSSSIVSWRAVITSPFKILAKRSKLLSGSISRGVYCWCTIVVLCCSNSFRYYHWFSSELDIL